MRRCPPPVAAEQTIVGDVYRVEEEDVFQEEERLLIMSGATFPAPDLSSFEVALEEQDVEEGGRGEGGPLLIKSGTTFPAPDLSEEPDPNHELKEKVREDRSPLLIKSGATFPAPELDDTVTGAEVRAPQAPSAERLEPAWPVRWSLRGVVLLAPVVVIAGLILATAPDDGSDEVPTTVRDVTTHGSLVPVEQTPVPEELPLVPKEISEPLPKSILPKSVLPASQVEKKRASKKKRASNKGTASTGRTDRRVRRLLISARQSVRQRRWSRARSRAAAALKIMPRNRRAMAIRKLAVRKLRKHRRHLAGARKAMKRRQWSRARAHAVAALKVNPRDARAKRIKRLAERRLRRRPSG
jgi:hypothetical protein